MTRLALAFILLAFPAMAQSPMCAHRPVVIDGLKAEFNEVPAARGIVKNGDVVELLLSPEGTWTVVVSHPTGKTCVILGGEVWEPVDKPKGPAT